ncbi:MAG: GDSL-type esterase/lipase family protein [Salinivirgaceae bacterium]|nr:GDSL-type esterase/lipase family protein [Salinivirgaceae bacterium]MDD4746140.1 GDSL-type esterase/lipase family protein [Salinivirgaceae bacterium]MDY0279916.1 GDSL-type esterase/lipase family protein [Salinivirgaceae bacterium]
MNRPLKPSTLFLLTLATLLILGAVSLILNQFPIQFFGTTITLPHPISMFQKDSVSYTNIDTLVTNVLKEIETEEPVLQIDSVPNDTIIEPILPQKTEEKIDTVRVIATTIQQRIHKLQFPPDNPKIMESFYNALRTETGKRNIRILHYGDSQIEGDRLTGYIRNRFQKRFGGSGPGLLLCDKPIADHATINQKASDDWKRDNVMQKKDTVANAIGYGIMGQTNQFSAIPPNKAWLSYELSNLSYHSARKYNRCRLFIGHSETPLDIEIYGGDSLLMKDQIQLEEPLNVFGFQIDNTPNDIVFKFESEQSPSFYALSLDQISGISVDNIPWRGSSGAEFSLIEQQLLSYFFKQINVRLIVFQFGVNIVPNVVKGYKWYEELLVQQLQHLRKAAGDTPIIVVGVSDMSRKKDTWYESYPNIPAIRDAQRNAAFRTGCAFWDLYEAMGGKNSMPSWVFAQPPLARTDFVHFNPRGGRIVAHMFYEALMHNYK